MADAISDGERPEVAAWRADRAQHGIRIRIKWRGHAWWAYFNGWPESYFVSESLPDMCNAIAATWPRGSGR